MTNEKAISVLEENLRQTQRLLESPNLLLSDPVARARQIERLNESAEAYKAAIHALRLTETGV